MSRVWKVIGFNELLNVSRSGLRGSRFRSCFEGSMGVEGVVGFKV